jgi:hypothetical protein
MAIVPAALAILPLTVTSRCDLNGWRMMPGASGAGAGRRSTNVLRETWRCREA